MGVLYWWWPSLKSLVRLHLLIKAGQRNKLNRKMVFLEVELPWKVVISPNQLDAKGLLLKKAIVLRLLQDIAGRKSSDKHGYYVAVTTLSDIGEGKVRELTGDVLFPVIFKCITMKPMKGEIFVGKVDKVLKHGILLQSGPVENVFISAKSMGEYKFVSGENSIFENEKHSKIDKESMVRFKVLGSKWIESDRDFRVLGTLAGHYLGPI